MKRALLAGTVVVVALAAWFVLREEAPAPTAEASSPVVARPKPAAFVVSAEEPPPVDAGEVLATVLVAVTDAENRALAGAEVSAKEGEVEHKGTTGADGAVALRVAPGAWRIHARAPGFVPQSLRETLVAGTTTRRAFALIPGGMVRGIVVTAEGVPVASARVDGVWKQGDGISKRSAVTGSDGTFVLDGVDLGARVVLRVASDVHPVEEAAVTAPDERVRIVLRAGLQVRVKVKEANGQPAVGCIVSLFPAGTAMSPGRFRGLSWQRGPTWLTTGSDGVAHFRGVGPGLLVAYARHESGDGGDGGPFGSANANADRPLTELGITLTAGFVLEGNVVDDSGAAITGARVLIRKTVETSELETTDAAGRFRTQLFDAPPWQVSAMAQGHETARAETNGPSVTLTLKRLAALTGRVVDATGAAVTKFSVNDTDVTAADGRFSVPSRPARKQSLEIEAVGFATAKVAAREGQLDFGDIVLQRGRSVTVTVVDAATQRPIANAGVRGPGTFNVGMVDDAPRAEGAATDANGVATLDGIGDTATVQVRHPDYAIAEIAVPPGATTLRVALDAGGTVRLRVTGERAAGAIEMTRFPDGRNLVMVRNRESTFHLPAGRYAFRVMGRRPPELAHEVQVTAGSTAEVVFAEPQGIPFEVHVVPAPIASEVLIVAGDVPAPTRAADWAWMSQVAAKARIANGVAAFPALSGRVTVFVEAYPGYHRVVADTAAGKIQVTMPATLARVPVE